MKKKELKKQIEDLTRRVEALEARPHYGYRFADGIGSISAPMPTITYRNSGSWTKV